MDIHQTEQRLKTLWIRTEKYCVKDIDNIRKFQDEMFANGLSNNRALLYLNAIYSISKITEKKLADLTKDEIKEIVAEIERSNKAEWTKVKYKLTLKKFYQFVEKLEWYSKEYPDRVKWINSGARKSKLLRPIILTEDEVKRLFKAAERGREKAMCSFMYESGCRCPDELFHMKVGDVEFDEYGAKVKLTSGKVGTRNIRIISSVPYMKIWINEDHP
ncbi:MAG: tyrosine-type recombinase/integrase [Nanoarchaeota archaeon]|nr:tyrosine-type recombinase/integrase [Nanoarchaeota archaeon]